MSKPLHTDTPAVTPVGSKGDYLAPVSNEQRRLWYLAQKSPDDTSYVMAYRLTLSGPLMSDTVEAALRDLVARHEILRSRVIAKDGVPVLYVSQATDLRLETRELSTLPREARDEEADRQARDLTRTPFSLSAGPLLRCRLLRLDADRHHLVIVMHHIIGDGWSHSVLIRDFCAFYRQRLNGLAHIDLPPLPLQFSDYALWQQEFEQSTACAKQVDHWVQLIGPMARDIDLPRDGTVRGPVPAIQHSERISGALFDRLKARCRDDGHLLSSVCFAAYQATLAYFADQHRFVTGLVTANRTTAETADLVGFFANTLVLPATLDSNETFTALLRRVHNQMVEVQDNQQAPFDKVVEQIGLPRNWDDIAPVSALFVQQNAPVGEFDLPGISVAVERLSLTPAKFPLTLFVVEVTAQLTLELDYAPEAFSDAAMAQFGALLKAHIAAYADGRPMWIGQPDLPSTCTASLIHGRHEPDWLSTPVCDLIAAQAKELPDAIALEGAFGRLRYRDLMMAVETYETTLEQALGDVPGAVAIALQRSAGLLVAILAVMRIGRAWVPVDPDGPKAYRADSTIGLSIAAVIGSTAPDGVICLAPPDMTCGRPASPPSAPIPPRTLSADDLAYIVSTSGSTGRPKHVHVEHGGLANVCRWIARALALSPKDKAIWKTHIEFDAVNREIFPILMSGGTLVIGPPDAQNDMACLADTIAATGVTHLHCVPSQLDALLARTCLPTGLKSVMCGGEALPSSLASALRSQRPDLRVFNVYGPTETTVDVTAFESCEETAGPVPIGPPLPNVTIEIRRRGRSVPIGAVGELWVAGPQVAREITSPDGQLTSFGPPGSRWFDTGDRATLGGDGALRFQGRNDKQIKRNGVRIEPALLERVLAEHPSVAAAQVIPVTAPDGSARLVAFVCPLLDHAVHDEPAPTKLDAGWRPVFEASYERLDRSLQPVQNTHGWIDSATRDPIPPQDVLAVIDLAAQRIQRWKPRRILELGCGIGTLGFRLATDGTQYHGIDFAAPAIEFACDRARIQGVTGAKFEVGNLESFVPSPGACFDAVILNSVVQYLPDQTALSRLLKRVMTYLDEGGFVFLGDLRDTRLAKPKALWRLSQTAPRAVSAVERALAAGIEAMREDELTLAPAQLVTLATTLGCAPPLIELKTCPGENELVRFRYDATLVRKGADCSSTVESDDILAQHEARNALVAPYLGQKSAVPDALPLEYLTPFELATKVGKLHPDTHILCSPAEQPDCIVCRAVPKHLTCAALCNVVAAPQTATPEHASLPWHRCRAQLAGLDVFLNTRLPKYLRPDNLIALPEMPLLANGKRSLGALRLLAEAAQLAPQGPVPEPGTDAAAIATVFERLLDRRIGADDTFFAAGGNSLLATQACSQISRLLGCSVPLKLFFDNASPRLLARALETRSGASVPPRITRRDNVAEAVPSFAQRRLWFIEKLGTAQKVYSIAHAARLSGPLDLVVLRRALGDLTARHAPLRAAFPEADGQPLVRISPPDSLAPIESLPSGLSQKAAIARVLAARSQPFDLAEGPLFRVLHAPLGPDNNLLAVLAHHIILDGWSMAIVLRDLAQLYQHHLDPGSAAPPNLAVDYFDLAAHQAESVATGAYDAQITYWTGQLDGAPQRLPLPCDFPETGRRSWQGDEVTFRIPKSLMRRVTQLCEATGTTEFMVLLAVFKVLLFRVSAAHDLVVGTVIANRHLPETENLAGFLVNPLALRSRLEPEWSFRQMLRHVKDTSLAAFENQDVPFEILLEHLDTDRRSDYQAVFQVMFAMQNTPSAALALPGLTSKRVRLAGTGAMFDLGLEIRLDGDVRIGVLEYATDRFERRTVERMAARYVTLLDALLRDSDTTIGTVPMTGPAEVAEILRFSRGPALEDAPGDSLPGRVAQIARTDPDRPALTTATARHSYGALQRGVERLADHLAQAGVTEGDRVGLMLPRTPAVAAAFLAVQTCRALPVYLNPSLPRDRLLHLASQARLDWIVRDPDTSSLLGTGDVSLPVDLFSQTTAHAATPPDLGAAPAYATFTSGSSGRPKAVLISQAAITARLRANDQLFGIIGADDRFAHAYSFDYDGGLVSLFWPLTRGAETVFMPLSALGNMTELTASLANECITVFDTIPAVLSQLYDAWPRDGLPGLRLVVTGGDTCPADLAARHFGLSDAIFSNQYGPCEGVVNASSAVIGTGREADRDLTIGKPIPGADIFIMDPSGGLSGIGMRGEIAIGGDWIADGYVDAPDLTSSRFVTRDLPGLGKRRLYLSGDLGSWRNSGEIEFLGRADRQVQIDGMRVDPAEIETVLAARPDVLDARVLVIGTGDTKRVAAFVVPAVAAIDENSTLQARWAEAFDRLYQSGVSNHPDQTRDFCGWSDTATGAPLPPVQMNAWLDETLALLRSRSTRKVLEIGAGLGLIACALAGEVDRYVATDISARACARLQATGRALGLSALDVRHLAADEVPAAYSETRFDLIVLNSVVQYLPGAGSLRRLLVALLPLLTPDGMLFVGDVRDLRLRRRFYAQVHARRIDAGLAVPSAEADIPRQEAQDEELYVDPKLFWDVARTAGSNVVATVLHKSGGGPEELVDYRFDAILRRQRGPRRDIATIKGTDMTPDAIGDRLDTLSGPLLIRGLSRLGPKTEIQAWIAAAEARNRPAALLAEADAENCSLYVPDSAPLSTANLPVTPGFYNHREVPLTNQPGFTDVTRRLQRGLRTALTAQLPAHMVPSQFHIVPEFPMRDGAKVDETALLKLAQAQTQARAASGRDDLAIAIMRDIWAGILGSTVQADDADFFAQGGHSLLAARLAARIEREFRVSFPVIKVFELRRLDAIADYASQAVSNKRPANITRLDPLKPAPPPSDHQKSILGRLAAMPARHRHIGLTLDLTNRLRLEPLRLALEQVSQTHPILRRRYPDVANGAHDDACPQLDIVDPGADSLTGWLKSGLDPIADGPLALALSAGAAGAASHLALKAHPFAFDGASVRILLRDLALAYQAADRPAPASAPLPAPCDYAAFAALDHADPAPGASDQSVAAWPWSGSVETVTHTLTLPVVQAIDEQAAQLGVTPASIYLAAFARVLTARGLLTRPHIACSFSARGRLQRALSERLIGPLAHDLPITLENLAAVDLEDGYQMVAEAVADVFVHGGVFSNGSHAEAGFSYRHASAFEGGDAEPLRAKMRLVSSPQFYPVRLSLLRKPGSVEAGLYYSRSLLSVEHAIDLLHDSLPKPILER